MAQDALQATREAIAKARIAQVKSGRYWPMEQLELFPMSVREVVAGLRADRPRRRKRASQS